MKPIKLFSVLTLICFGAFLSKSYAQVDVTVSPFGLLWGDLNVGADFNLGENMSVEASVGFGSRNDGGYKFSAVPVTGTFKYYFNPNNGCDKFYADAFLKFISRNYTDKDSNDGVDYYDYSQTRLGFGLGLGYKVASKKGIIFDIGFGAGRAIIDNTKFEDENGVDTSIDWPDIMFTGKLGIGYRFGGK